MAASPPKKLLRTEANDGGEALEIHEEVVRARVREDELEERLKLQEERFKLLSLQQKAQEERFKLLSLQKMESDLELQLMKKIHLDSSSSFAASDKAFQVGEIEVPLPTPDQIQQCFYAADQAVKSNSEVRCKGERRGQIWLMGLLDCLCENNLLSGLYPVDASRGNFLGLTIQPDVVIIEREAEGKVVLEHVRGVIELKAGATKKQAAVSQLLQRAYEIIKGRSLFGQLVDEKILFSLTGAVVDDDSMEIVQVKVTRQVQVARYAQVLKANQGAFVGELMKLFAAVKPLRPEGRSSIGGEGSESVITLQSQTEEKPSVYYRGKGEQVVKRYRLSSKAKYFVEKRNLEKLLAVKVHCPVEHLGNITFDDNSYSISMEAGCPCHISTLQDLNHAITSLLRHSASIHEAGLVHGDISPRNIVMRQLNGKVDYFVIDFGEAESVDDDKKRFQTLRQLVTVPYTPKFDQTRKDDLESKKSRDKFAVLCSCIWMYLHMNQSVEWNWGCTEESAESADIWTARRDLLRQVENPTGIKVHIERALRIEETLMQPIDATKSPETKLAEGE